MNKEIEKFINYIPEFNNFFENNLNLNKLKNCIIKNIIKSKKYDLFFNQNLQNHTNIFSNFDDSLIILNFAENNKNASKYHSIINQYVFDTTLKIISKKKIKIL